MRDRREALQAAAPDDGLPTYRAIGLERAVRRGSSMPLVLRTTGGRFLTKLRGAAQGTAALVAEFVVAELAEHLGLRVPKRALIAIDESMECADRDAELGDLVRASRGANLGFAFLDDAADLRADQTNLIDEHLASQIVWLDGLVGNSDRTARNPNILLYRGSTWLIDHGAALPFHHDWTRVTEEMPRRASGTSHLLLARARWLDDWDEYLAPMLSRERLRGIAERIPESFLSPLVTPIGDPAALFRRRRAYEAFLWKRLKPPRPFVAPLRRAREALLVA